MKRILSLTFMMVLLFSACLVLKALTLLDRVVLHRRRAAPRGVRRAA